MKKEHNIEEKVNDIMAVAEHTQYIMSRDEAIAIGWEPEKWVNTIEVLHYPEINTMQIFYNDKEGYVKIEEEEKDAEVINSYLEDFEELLSQAMTAKVDQKITATINEEKQCVLMTDCDEKELVDVCFSSILLNGIYEISSKLSEFFDYAQNDFLTAFENKRLEFEEIGIFI